MTEQNDEVRKRLKEEFRRKKMVNTKFQTIKYFKASQLGGVSSSSEAAQVISNSGSEDSIAVLLTITNHVMIEKAVNITKEGFNKIRTLIPA